MGTAWEGGHSVGGHHMLNQCTSERQAERESFRYWTRVSCDVKIRLGTDQCCSKFCTYIFRVSFRASGLNANVTCMSDEPNVNPFAIGHVYHAT